VVWCGVVWCIACGLSIIIGCDAPRVAGCPLAFVRPRLKSQVCSRWSEAAPRRAHRVGSCQHYLLTYSTYCTYITCISTSLSIRHRSRLLVSHLRTRTITRCAFGSRQYSGHVAIPRLRTQSHADLSATSGDVVSTRTGARPSLRQLSQIIERRPMEKGQCPARQNDPTFSQYIIQL